MFDILKDGETGKVHVTELKAAIKAKSQAKIARKSAELMANKPEAAKESLMKSTQNVDSELKEIERQKADFTASLSGGSGTVSQEQMEERAAKLREIEAKEKAIQKKSRDSHRMLVEIRKKEVADRNAASLAKAAAAMKSIEGKTPFSLREKTGGGGGGEAEAPKASMLFDPSKKGPIKLPNSGKNPTVPGSETERTARRRR